MVAALFFCEQNDPVSQSRKRRSQLPQRKDFTQRKHVPLDLDGGNVNDKDAI